jgi:hypothetical protein
MQEVCEGLDGVTIVDGNVSGMQTNARAAVLCGFSDTQFEYHKTFRMGGYRLINDLWRKSGWKTEERLPVAKLTEKQQSRFMGKI